MGMAVQVTLMGTDEPAASGARNPPVRRRELGALLRALRADAGLTVEQVAEHLLCSHAKVSRMETGQRGASLRDVRDLCDLYGLADSTLRDHMMSLARQGRGQAWWQPFDLPYATYVGLEAEALSIRDYEPGVFPGLLQVPEYARAIHEGAMPRLSGRVIDERIEVRRIRQNLLYKDEPTTLAAVIDEAVLHRIVGGPTVMRRQIGRVIEACSLPNVTLRVIPFSAGAHPALDSTFIILEQRPPVPSVVYVEGLVGQIYLERPQDVQRYVQVFDRLSSLALDSAKSRDLMLRISAKYEEN
jgi:transcriptional regulator with XRE-family HTH domain